MAADLSHKFASSASISGDALADLLASAGDTSTGGGVVPAVSALSADIKTARDIERKHEIVALVADKLTINYGNYKRFREASDPAEATMVVSFLGDTAVGKSTSIRELMSSVEERPFVQRSTDQTSSTTSNVNLYPCKTLFKGMTVNFLDFEGESGSSVPSMALKFSASRTHQGLPTATGSSLIPGVISNVTEAILPSSYEALTAAVVNRKFAGEASILDRAKHVREHFPRFAYCSSDVIVLIGTDKLFGSRYLERALTFAKQANTNIQDVELPVLLIISNKVDVDECEMNIERTTRNFQDQMGRDLAQIDSYFSCIVVCQLPNRKTTAVTDDGRMLLGSEMYAEQINKIRTLLASLLNSRLAERNNRFSGAGGPGRRVITSRHGLWYAMLPRIVEKLNSDEPVHFARLVDEAWAEHTSSFVDRDAPLDIFKTFHTYIRPPAALSRHAPRMHEDYIMRFTVFFELACEITVRLVAARLRSMDKSLLFEDRVEAVALPQLEAALRMLDDITPCRAVYGEDHKGAAIELGVPLERPEEPLLCLQERRVHTKSHRGARRVKGGGPTVWQRLLSVVPYNPTWQGDFQPCIVSRPTLRTLLDEVHENIECTDEEFFRMLLNLQSVSCPSLRIVFAPLTPRAADIPTEAVMLDDGPLCVLAQSLQSPMMPYCVGCSRRVRQSERAVSPEPAVLSPPSDEESHATHGWSMSIISEFLTLASAEARHLFGVTKASPAKTVSFGENSAIAASGSGKRGGLKRALADYATAGVAQQEVILGLCDFCVDTTLRWNAVWRNTLQ